MGNDINDNNLEQNIKDSNEDLFKDESKINKIKLIYKVNYSEENIRLFGSSFYQNNKNKCNLCIDFVINEFSEFYKAKTKESRIDVILAISKDITDLSYMFNDCSSLLSISYLNNLMINNVTNLSYMFSGCSSLKSISGISNWKTNRVYVLWLLFFNLFR